MPRAGLCTRRIESGEVYIMETWNENIIHH